MKRLIRMLAPLVSLLVIALPVAFSAPALAAPPPTVLGKNKNGGNITVRYGHYPKGSNLPSVPSPSSSARANLSTFFSGLTTVAHGLNAQVSHLDSLEQTHGVSHLTTTNVVYSVYSAQVFSSQLPAQSSYDLSRNMQKNPQITGVSAHLQHTLAVNAALQRTGQEISVALYGHGSRAALASHRLPRSYQLAVARLKHQLVPQLLADIPKTRSTRHLEAALVYATNQLASLTTVPTPCTVPTGLGYNTFDTPINIDVFTIEANSYALAASIAKATAQMAPAELVEGAEVLGEGATTTFPDPIRIALEAVATTFGILGKGLDTLTSGMALGHDMVVGCYHKNLMAYTTTNYANINAVSSQVSGVSTQVSNVKTQISGVSTQVSGVSTKLNTVSGQIKAVAQSVGNTLAVIKTDFGTVDTDFATVFSDFSTLETNLSNGVNTILAALKTDFSKEMSALGVLQQSVNTANAGIVTNRHKLDVLTVNLAQDAKTMEGQLTSAHNLQLEQILSKGTLIVTMALPNADGGRLNTVQQLDAAIIVAAQKAGLPVIQAQGEWQTANTELGKGAYARAYLDYAKAYQFVQSKLAQTE